MSGRLTLAEIAIEMEFLIPCIRPLHATRLYKSEEANF